MTTVKVSRAVARLIIERVREHAVFTASEANHEWAKGLLAEFGIPELTECPGPAHGPDSQQDHCSLCMPRWGCVGPRVVIP